MGCFFSWSSRIQEKTSGRLGVICKNLASILYDLESQPDGTYSPALSHLGIDPFPEPLVLVVQKGSDLEDWEEPQRVAKQADACHVRVQRLHEIVLHTILKHVEGLTPGQITHHIEAVKVKPVGYVDGSSLGHFEMGK